MPKQWITLDVNGLLNGSIRAELNPAERSIFIDLIALASETDDSQTFRNKVNRLGYIEFSKGKPKSIEWIASRIQVDLELLQATIQKLIEQDRIRYIDNTYVVVNYEKYQLVEKKKREYSHNERLLREHATALKIADNETDWLIKNSGKLQSKIVEVINQ